MTIESMTWERFRTRLFSYASLHRERRCSLLFRGQPNSGWALSTTLDRAHCFSDDDDRKRTIRRLLSEFERESLEVTPYPQIAEEQLELLARHHGLPSPLMDWTNSPYVAAYFAYATAQADAGFVSVWLLDRQRVSDEHLEGIDFVDEPSSLRFNLRAFRQRSVFVRAKRDTRVSPLQDVLGDSLFRYDLPIGDRQVALAELDEMRINAGTLFADLTGVAATVAARVLEERNGH
jgi:hypothetical protein